MALVLRAQVRGVIAPRDAGKLSVFSPLSSADWRGKSRPADAFAADRRAAPTFFTRSRRQAASVGILSRHCRFQAGQPRWQRSSDVVESCPWTR